MLGAPAVARVKDSAAEMPGFDRMLKVLRIKFESAEGVEIEVM